MSTDQDGMERFEHIHHPHDTGDYLTYSKLNIEEIEKNTETNQFTVADLLAVGLMLAVIAFYFGHIIYLLVFADIAIRPKHYSTIGIYFIIFITFTGMVLNIGIELLARVVRYGGFLAK